jgi:hypothetical protein
MKTINAANEQIHNLYSSHGDNIKQTSMHGRKQGKMQDIGWETSTEEITRETTR